MVKTIKSRWQVRAGNNLTNQIRKAKQEGYKTLVITHNGNKTIITL